MKVSVVACTYAMDRYDDFSECIDSLLSQTYDQIEIIVVVDGNRDVFDRFRSDFGDNAAVAAYCNDENRGVSYSRTRGAELATGDVVAFIDDDATAAPTWVEELVNTYEETDAIAAGGKMTGDWIAGKPATLPEEFYWLIGVTYPGFASSGDEIRNTFESNISFRRDVFVNLGGFDPELGPDADSYSHSEGAEIGTRLQRRYGRGVVYNPDAIVAHKVFEHRTKLRWLLARAFEQGRSKRRLERRETGSKDSETAYLQQLLGGFVPRRLRSLAVSPSLAGFVQFVMLFVFTGAVGSGYVYETLSRH
ncbi:glucosyl-dolichyl phosphate glucuronosyltransferase [Natronorubrum daqingense]|uniref:Glycosyl transferase family 2 n=1 Tax=Natronorubrum daqingense TaxID=588898 RepID=A0A1N7C324_9EURY|nr:glucosyl-dolichyl phosphate glucuronosyltransferase [Natronorubrum daqingense]APX96716.1 glycosyl transferase family A [Natronorubrum daqingense]SIR57962.1 Glycosyl transferase family 2 [Natronorubrum daqingense]